MKKYISKNNQTMIKQTGPATPGTSVEKLPKWYQCRKGTFRLSPKCSLNNYKGKLLRSLRNVGPSADHRLIIDMPNTASY